MRMLKTGLTEWDRDRATPGLTLFATIRGEAARLIDMTGKVVHQWRLHSPSSGQVQMLPGGRLLATEISDDGRDIRGGGKGESSASTTGAASWSGSIGTQANTTTRGGCPMETRSISAGRKCRTKPPDESAGACPAPRTRVA